MMKTRKINPLAIGVTRLREQRRSPGKHTREEWKNEQRSFEHDVITRIESMIDLLQSAIGNEGCYATWPVKGVPQARITIRGKKKEEMEVLLRWLFADRNTDFSVNADNSLDLTIGLDKEHHKTIVHDFDELVKRAAGKAIEIKEDELGHIKSKAKEVLRAHGLSGRGR